MSVRQGVHQPPYPVWREKNGTVGTVCSVCGRYLSGEPPRMCAECAEAARAVRRARRLARKAVAS